RAHDQHLKALPFRLRQELVVATGACIFQRLAGHLDVTTERKRANAVLGVATTNAEDGRIETELEFQNADANAFGGEEMSKLVHEHEHTQYEGKRQNGNHAKILKPSTL